MSWRQRRALVTGAGGFIGSHLTEALVAAGAQVRALVHYNALGTSGWLDALDPDVQSQIDLVAGDITDPDSVQAAMKDVEVVFHLAALIAIPYSYLAPASYVRTNIEGTMNVLQAARTLRPARVVHTSTSEVYGSARYTPIDEAHALHTQSPYAASKLGADKLAEAFHLSYGVPIVTVRPFNTFGPRQSLRAVVPAIIRQCLEGRRIQLGHLHPVRDLTYVSDTVAGFMSAASASGAVGGVFNLGTGEGISIGDLANRIVSLTGTRAVVEFDEQRVRPAASEVDRLIADASRARHELGWAPAVSLDDGLRRTIAWQKQLETSGTRTFAL